VRCTHHGKQCQAKPLNLQRTTIRLCLARRPGIHTTQKNGVRGELIGLGRSGHPFFCPVLATVNCVKHLRLHQAHPTTPLYQYFNIAPHTLTTNELTQQLRFTCNILGHTVGINSADISIHSLWSSGAMALLWLLPHWLRLWCNMVTSPLSLTTVFHILGLRGPAVAVTLHCSNQVQGTNH